MTMSDLVYPTEVDFKIKVEAVNCHVLIVGVEGPGDIGRRVVGTKDLVHFLGKLFALGC